MRIIREIKTDRAMNALGNQRATRGLESPGQTLPFIESLLTI